ncbi:MAG: SpoIVB peptidase S55 domain-containing protein [Polyangiales bacterium]
MRRLLSALCFISSASLLLGSLVWGGAIAQSTPGFIHVDEIRPGMKGYGLSVLRGTEPERFDVEVIDVLHQFRPNQDLILIRTPHPLLDRARGVAGMSGSPIYLDGRLAGAYAYGWSYGVDPVVGVTPIANMLAELKRPVRLDMFPGAKPLPGRPSAKLDRHRPSKERLAGLPSYRGEHEVSALSTLRALHEKKARNKGPLGLHQASTPLMLGGLDDAIAQMIAKELEPLGFVATQAGTGGSSTSGPRQFEPGGAVAVQLARGDIAMTAVGTITYVGKGGRTLAFGHPMMEAGATGLPTATARVVHVLVSEARSFKIAEAGRSLGALVQDRQPAIVIDPDIQAASIPIRVKVNGAEGAPKTEWNVEVASHRVLTPGIVFAVIANAVKSTASDATDVIFRARSKIGIEGHGVVSLEEQGFSPMGAASAAVFSQLRMFGLMEAAFANPFEISRVTSIDLELDLELSREVFQISDASVAYDEVDPGEEVTIYVKLRRVEQPDTIRAVKVRVPEAAAGQTIRVAILPGNKVAVEQPRARSLGDLIERANRRYAANSMVVALQMPTRGLRFEGHVVDSLPASALNTLQFVSSTEDSHPFVTQSRTDIKMPQVVVGGTNLALRVREVALDQLLGE